MDRTMPMQTRRASLQPSSVNAESRTVEVVWSTGARVRRLGWDGPYDEELSLDPAAVDLSRLNGGANLLNSHDSYSLSGVVGVVERAWIDGGEGRAVVRFSDREDVEPIWRDVAAGIIRNVSVGYQVRRFEIDKSGAVPVYRAVDWQPMELSLVAIPADSGAQVREAGAREFPVVIGHAEEFKMPDIETPPVVADAGESRAVPLDSGVSAADVAAAVAAERARITEIRSMAERYGSDAALVDRLIADGASARDAQVAMLDAFAVRTQEVNRRTGPAGLAQVLSEPRDHLRQHAVEAVLNRFDPVNYPMTEGAREFRGLRLVGLARECLQSAGVSVRGLTEYEIAGMALGLDASNQRAHTASDFPYILSTAATKTLRMAYDAAPRTFTGWARRASFPDFKTRDVLQLGEAPQLKVVKENGEITFGTIGESREQYALTTYARRVAVSRQAIVNDDLSAFTRIPQSFGAAAAALEGDVVYAILSGNAALADGVALFHATHDNLAGTATAISAGSLGAARAAMRTQKGIDGTTVLNVQPRYLIVPAAKETIAEQTLSGLVVAATPANLTPPSLRTLTIVAEPRLDDSSTTAWYLAADPAQIDTVEYAYLEGSEGVRVETRLGWEIEGLEIKAVLDFGAKAIDYRGLYKNPGA